MTVSFELPTEIEQQLAISFGDLGVAAKQSLLLDAYRQGRVSIGKLAETLGMGVIEAQQWLASKHAMLNYGLDELKADRRTLDKLFDNVDAQ